MTVASIEQPNAHSSHATMAAEIASLRAKNKALRESLADVTKLLYEATRYIEAENKGDYEGVRRLDVATARARILLGDA